MDVYWLGLAGLAAGKVLKVIVIIYGGLVGGEIEPGLLFVRVMAVVARVAKDRKDLIFKGDLVRRGGGEVRGDEGGGEEGEFLHERQING